MNSRDTTLEGKTLLIDEASAPGEVSADQYLSSLPLKPQDRYKFIRSIGFGGMKGVLLVHDRDTDREMAMAIMPDFRDRTTAELERFANEAYLTAKLEHPNIVPVYDIGIDNSGSPFFTMKYLRGSSLETLLQRIRKADTAEAREYTMHRLLLIFHRLCNAVGFAHSRGYCHLDLKPGNVNISDFGETFVIDWGLARKLDENGEIQLSRVGVRGTPGFMAPEQFDPRTGLPIGVHSDIFALGAILYSMLALESPCARMPVEETLRHTASGTIPRPSEMAPDFWSVPSSLEAIAIKAMSPHPRNRYSNVRELKADIMAYSSGFAPKAERASTLKRSKLFFNRNYLLIIIFILLMILAWQMMGGVL